MPIILWFNVPTIVGIEVIFLRSFEMIDDTDYLPTISVNPWAIGKLNSWA